MMIINQPKEDHFKLGILVNTHGVTQWTTRSAKNLKDLNECIKRHCQKDWGDGDEEDKQSNDLAVDGKGKIMSVYKNVGSETTKDVRDLWIITEWDRSVTTALFPEEY